MYIIQIGDKDHNYNEKVYFVPLVIIIIFVVLKKLR